MNEEIVAESSNFIIDLLEVVLKRINIKEVGSAIDKNFKETVLYFAKLGAQIEQEARKSGLMDRSHSLTTKLINHLNRLAGEEEINSQPLSATEEQAIERRLTEARNLNSQGGGDKAGSGLSGLSFSNLLAGSDKMKPADFNVEKFMNEVGKVKSSPKWYQNPWIIVPSLIGAAVGGGLITWLCLRKKESKRASREYY